MGYASEHFINSSKDHDKSLPYIRITNYVLSGCPSSQNNCSIDEAIKLTANEKFNRLVAAVPNDQILPKMELKNLDTSAFVYKKTEKDNRFSKGYVINLGDDVVEIDFVNYELLSDVFIENFLNRISFEQQIEEVSFCGKTFKTEVVILNNVNIIKRIAILSQNNKHGICENIITNSPKGEFSLSINKQKSTDADYRDGIYFLNISVLNFRIDLNTNNIYVLGAFAGEPTLLGKLK